MTLALHPTWGGSGLRHTARGAPAGVGNCRAAVTINVPSFSRDIWDQDLWMRPARANFRFKPASGKVVDVSPATKDSR